MKKEDVDPTGGLNLAEQLRYPNDNDGGDFGRFMYDNNKKMILDSIALLRLTSRNSVLEIGPGNALHLELLLSQAPQL